ncbi:hypothetical protein Salat_2076300 [Sesamum alatum]|uniref:RNase H type-1 domain-containing protein n=1 Tax=Sesamum alatum TaxID=300844 RepID=A0AAE1Y1D0_9LAMI|nr:hypothetical protein Salat_2076300 [Sesamum alatum]
MKNSFEEELSVQQIAVGVGHVSTYERLKTSMEVVGMMWQIVVGLSRLRDFENSVVAFYHPGQRSNCSWSAPTEGMVKINFDTAFTPGSYLTGLGVIARNSLGRCLHWMLVTSEHVTHPEHGEALADLMAIELGCQMGGSHYIIEGDCIQVI